jgi:hypothetical protein
MEGMGDHQNGHWACTVIPDSALSVKADVLDGLNPEPGRRGTNRFKLLFIAWPAAAI